MTENITTNSITPQVSTADRAENAQIGLTPDRYTAPSTSTTRGDRAQNRFVILQVLTKKYFEGSTSKIGGVLALHSENLT